MKRVMRLSSRLRALVRDDEGQDLLEYALLAALIAAVVLTSVGAVGSTIGTFWGHITTNLPSL
jgi:Flp pilus assembly pilin Flp